MADLEEMISDTNIESIEELPSPNELISGIPSSARAKQTVIESRKAIKDILDKKDSRVLIIAGPCSIHDPVAGLEYAQKLKKISEEVSDVAYIVMRTYLEKPRTITGWKGLLYDPNLDETEDMLKGIKIGRKFLLDVSELGLPCANEFVNTYFPQYISDLVSWSAIGARNVEFQGSKELASGLSMPVGFKNSTSGDIEVAVNACKSATAKHAFPGLAMDGKPARVKTKGNKYVHVVLRGGNGQPNYHPEKVDETIGLMIKAGLKPNIIVDCSHANSNKQYEKQEQVAYAVLNQITSGKSEIVGIMLESNLYEGSQKFPKAAEEIRNLKYGVSITDSCIPPGVAERVIRKYAEEIRNYRNTLKAH
jgi:3-deoxy-7-phosphoheptulonate synthase